jgi:transcription initiation factor TFIID subunit TAF12
LASEANRRGNQEWTIQRNKQHWAQDTGQRQTKQQQQQQSQQQQQQQHNPPKKSCKGTIILHVCFVTKAQSFSMFVLSIFTNGSKESH